MDDSQDWCDEVVLWYYLDFNHSICREGTYCLLVNWDKCQKDEPCVATLPLLNYSIHTEEYKMHVMLNYKLYERQMVDDDPLNMSMENNESSMEEIEEEFDGICGAVKSLTERVSVLFQKDIHQ